jgi:hypothetical protein
VAASAAGLPFTHGLDNKGLKPIPLPANAISFIEGVEKADDLSSLDQRPLAFMPLSQQVRQFAAKGLGFLINGAVGRWPLPPLCS